MLKFGLKRLLDSDLFFFSDYIFFLLVIQNAFLKQDIWVLKAVFKLYLNGYISFVVCLTWLEQFGSDLLRLFLIVSVLLGLKSTISDSVGLSRTLSDEIFFAWQNKLDLKLISIDNYV